MLNISSRRHRRKCIIRDEKYVVAGDGVYFYRHPPGKRCDSLNGRFGKGEKGSFTVEATIVLSAVLFCIVAVVYFCLLLFQQSYLQDVADRTAERGAALWKSPAKDLFIAKLSTEGLKDINPYWVFFGYKEGDRVEKFAQLQVNAFSLFKSSEPKITVEPVNYVVFQKLRVTVSQSYKIPGANILKSFGLKNDFTISANAEVVVQEPAEFIRNTDFVIDTGKEIDRKYLSGKGAALADGIKESFSKLFKGIQNFFK